MTSQVATGDVYAEQITVRYGRVEAIRDVTIRAYPGQFVAVTGPSGAGKSSLLLSLAGVVVPNQGDVSFGGTALRGREDAIARGIVLIPQGNALAAVLTALENVAVPLLARQGLVRGTQESAMAMLAEVGLDEAADQLVDELSGGQQQRLAVARGLAQRGSVVLADEPTSELDSGNRAKVMQLLRAEAERGAIVLMATHDPETADMCDAELHLDAGAPSWARDDR
ncbi:MAG TPA: ATP-binding cassette domain-containing protein [Jatrophihabitantaceae bacterium]|nr:ATP-binding cassette domain-containing protein [Jatrophihabitantaceae bacterium]